MRVFTNPILIAALLAVATTSCRRPLAPSRASAPTTIEVEYVGWACGDFSPQLRPTDPSLPVPASLSGLVIYCPKGVEAPDQIDELRVPGNRFLITGYAYHHSDGTMAARFDLLHWTPLGAVSPLTQHKHSDPAAPSPTGTKPWKQGPAPATPNQVFAIAGRYDPC